MYEVKQTSKTSPDTTNVATHIIAQKNKSQNGEKKKKLYKRFHAWNVLGWSQRHVVKILHPNRQCVPPWELKYVKILRFPANSKTMLHTHSEVVYNFILHHIIPFQWNSFDTTKCRKWKLKIGLISLFSFYLIKKKHMNSIIFQNYRLIFNLYLLYFYGTKWDNYFINR